MDPNLYLLRALNETETQLNITNHPAPPTRLQEVEAGSGVVTAFSVYISYLYSHAAPVWHQADFYNRLWSVLHLLYSRGKLARSAKDMTRNQPLPER